MNRRAVIAEIRRLLDELEREEPVPAEKPRRKPMQATPRDFENLERARRRNGGYPPGAWKR